jgi:tripartite-type tricarboxylate transporter receptor subunit TctC
MQVSRKFWSLLTAGALALAAQPVAAQAWPAKPVKIIVAFTPGSATDIVGRAVADKLSGALGQPVIVENRPGAGGTIGTNVVAKADPDGYTLLINSSAHTSNPSIYANLPFDTLKDIVGVTTLAGQPNVLVVSSSLGFKTAKDLIAGAQVKPGSFNYASAGTGSGTHMNAEKFRIAAGIDAVHIPYKGTPEAMSDTMTARVTYFFAPITAALGPVRDGKLVALGVSTIKRSSALPNVPTVAESAGLKDFDFNLWVGLFAPAKTPRDIIAKLNREVVKVLNSAEMKERLVRIGADPMPMTPEQFDAYIREELAVNAKIAAAAGIKAQ